MNQYRPKRLKYENQSSAGISILAELDVNANVGEATLKKIHTWFPGWDDFTHSNGILELLRAAYTHKEAVDVEGLQDLINQAFEKAKEIDELRGILDQVSAQAERLNEMYGQDNEEWSMSPNQLPSYFISQWLQFPSQEYLDARRQVAEEMVALWNEKYGTKEDEEAVQ